MKLKTVWLVCLLLCLFIPQALAVKVNPGQLQALASTCVNLLQVGDFKGAAMMYHYPPGYDETELDADLAGVEKSLKMFVEEFGQINMVAPLENPELYVHIFATGGTHGYWQQYQNAAKVEMRAEFENYGAGYLAVQVVDILGLPEVKAIAFGLPVSGRSVERIKRAGDRMMQLMQEQSTGTAAR